MSRHEDYMKLMAEKETKTKPKKRKIATKLEYFM